LDVSLQLAEPLPQHIADARHGTAPACDHQYNSCLFLLVVTGRENDVVLVERLSWRPLEHGGYLTGGHASSVTALAFSPNGEAQCEQQYVVRLVQLLYSPV
jgi:hypothetical protein